MNPDKAVLRAPLRSQRFCENHSVNLSLGDVCPSEVLAGKK